MKIKLKYPLNIDLITARLDDAMAAESKIAPYCRQSREQFLNLLPLLPKSTKTTKSLP